MSATVERKIAALREHRSQIREPEKLESRVREWAAEDGKAHGVDGAEAFRVIALD